jgi:hypothetical protein
MTSEQRDRLLGMVLQGVSSVTACETLGVLPADLLAELDGNEPFRYSFYVAMQEREVVNAALGHLPER